MEDLYDVQVDELYSINELNYGPHTKEITRRMFEGVDIEEEKNKFKENKGLLREIESYEIFKN